MKKLYALDTMYHIFRSYYALPETLKAPSGVSTNVLFGMLGILRGLWKAECPDYCVAVFDSPGPTFREESDPSYKANRPPAPAALKEQIPLVIEMMGHLGIKTLFRQGYEADDILGTLARRCANAGLACAIVSNDKDLAQVLQFSDDLSLLRFEGSGKKAGFKSIARSDVKELYGVEPERIPDWLALKGDSSDNIKGVPGIGQKTAVKMLESHTLAEILENPELAGKKYGEVIGGMKESVLHDLDLATIRTDVPLDFEGIDIESFAAGNLSDDAYKFFAELNMKSFTKLIDDNLFASNNLKDIWG